MPQLELVVIGASAGSLRPLREIVAFLPERFPAAVIVVVHTRGARDSHLPGVLARDSRMTVGVAVDGVTVEPGCIYVAPPDFHVLLEDRTIRLSSGPRENGFRPAIDPLFRSAARAYGSRVMGVILSGALSDGTLGLRAIKEAGGVAAVQDPLEAEVPIMPQNALRHVEVDHALPARQIAEQIVAVSRQPVAGGPPMRKRAESDEPESQTGETSEIEDLERALGPPSALTCPDCGGALWEVRNGSLAHYRCHVGHQFTTDGLDVQQQDAVEGALWTAVRILEEQGELLTRMAERAEEATLTVVAGGFSDRAVESHQQAHTIRELLFHRVPRAAGSMTTRESRPRARQGARQKKRRMAR